MKRGYIGPYSLGFLDGLSAGFSIIEKFTNKRQINFKRIFYTTAFQAGIEEFLILDSNVEAKNHRSTFVESRCKYLETNKNKSNLKTINSIFSNHLPNGWEQNSKYSGAIKYHTFLADLLNAMSNGASLLSLYGIPDASKTNQVLPTELALPISNLIRAIEDINTKTPIPQKALPLEDMQKFKDIMLSDLFVKYSDAQALLDDSQITIVSAGKSIFQAGKTLINHNKPLLHMKKISIGVLKITP